MSNLEKLNKILVDVLKIKNIDEIDDSFGPNQIEDWDSLTQVELVTELEEKFEISLEVEDVSRMYTIGNIKKILRKYEVEI